MTTASAFSGDPPGPTRSSPPTPRGGSLATRVFLAQLVLLLVALVPLGIAAVQNAREAERARAVEVARSVTMTLVDDPWVLGCVTGPDPVDALGARIEQIRRDTGVDFVVVMDTDGTRYTHPDPAMVGGTFIGDIDGALAGEVTVEDARGTLGPSVRVVAPVRDADGEIVALVSTGVVLRAVHARVMDSLADLAVVLVVGLGVSVAAAWWLSRTVRRQTFGLGAQGLARLHSYYDALIESVGSGLVLMANDATVVVANDQAVTLLDLAPVPPGTPATALAGLGLDAELTELLASGRPADAELFAIGGRTLVVSQTEALSEGRRMGWIATIADRTELARASGELDNLRQFTDSLRARSHEADNRLHTVAMLVELGRYDDAIEFATASARSSQALTDTVVGQVADSALAALVLGKSAQGAERGVAVVVAELDVPAGVFDSQDLVTIVGNLVDNALDAASHAPAPRRVSIAGHVADGVFVLRVADSGPGVPPALRTRIFERGFSTKTGSPARPHGRGIGLSLVERTVHRCGGTIEVTDAVGHLSAAEAPSERTGRDAAAPGPAARPGTLIEVRLPVPREDT